MAKRKNTSKNEDIVFYPKRKIGKIIYMAIIILGIFLMLGVTIVKIKASLDGQVLDWQASWVWTALTLLLYVFLLTKPLREFFIIRLVLS